MQEQSWQRRDQCRGDRATLGAWELRPRLFLSCPGALLLTVFDSISFLYVFVFLYIHFVFVLNFVCNCFVVVVDGSVEGQDYTPA